ncbi:MAG TPA: SpoIIE family protein phosphatase [Coriobacteriia bacterium]|nr:SpoIIE family protein phosphatase [Coriobacteriia bacterium]
MVSGTTPTGPNEAAHAIGAGLGKDTTAAGPRAVPRRLEVLSDTSTILISGSDPIAAIKQIADIVMDYLGADVFFNYVLTDDRARLRLNACGGVDERIAKTIERLELGEAICGCVARDGEPIVSEDVQNNGDMRANLVRRMGIRCYACWPLKVGSETVGTMSFGTRKQTAYDPLDLKLIQTVASQVSIAIERSVREQALRQSEERFRSVLESTLDLAYRRDLATDTYDYLSPIVETMFGYTPAEFSVMSLSEVVASMHPSDLLAVTRELEESLSTGRMSCEYRFRHRDGHYVWVSDVATVTFDDAGRPRYRTGVARDISEQRRKKEALAESEKRLSMALSAGRMAAWDVDLVTGETHWNDDHYRLLGYQVGEVEPSFGAFLARIHPDDRKRAREVQERAALHGGDYSAELKIELPDKTIGWIHELGRVELNPQGEASRLYGVFENITDRKVAEQRREETIRFAEALNRIDAATHASLDVDGIMQSLVSQARAALGVDATVIELREGDTWPVRYASGLAEDAAGQPLTPEDAVFSRAVVDAGEILCIEDASRDERVAAQAVPHRISSAMGIPLVVRDETLGVLLMLQFGQKRAFSDLERDFALKLAASASLALENARLYESERRSATLAAALNSVNEILLASHTVEETLEAIVEHTATAIGADRVVYAQFGDDSYCIRHVFGLSQRLIDAKRPMSNLGWTAAELAAGRYAFIPDVIVDSSIVWEPPTPGDNAAFMLLPLRFRGETVGFLSYGYERARAFDAKDEEFAERLSLAINLAHENAHLYETEHDIAETLQDTLVALPDRIPGIVFSRAYESATLASGRVGGDFIDVFPVAEHTVGLTLGDVSGKGIDAAVATSMIRTTLRAHAIDQLPPYETVARANAMMRRFTSVESFATLWFGLLNTKTGQLRYVSAGHPPALVLSPDGGLAHLETGSPIIGAFDDAVYFESHSMLGRHERLVLYSDGMTEARSAEGVFLGPSGFEALVTKRASHRTVDLAPALVTDVVDYSAGVLRDDAAILVVEANRLRR